MHGHVGALAHDDADVGSGQRGRIVDAIADHGHDVPFAAQPGDEFRLTGVGLARERMLAPVRIVSPLYGTRCSSAVLVEATGRAQFAERSYEADGAERSTVYYAFERAA